MSRSRTRIVAALACIAFLSPLAGAQTPRVLLVGDSWADFLWQARSLAETFALHGHPEFVELGGETTVSGSEASEWVDPAMLGLIDGALAANPTIDIVQITLGGNDFLAGEPGGGWYLGMPDAGALYVAIASDVATVVDHVLALDPALRVLLSGYDYPNFVDFSFAFCLAYCCSMDDGLGGPAPLQLNSAIVAMGSLLDGLAATRPRLAVVHHWGLMQYAFGFPGAEPPIPPGALLPPGDSALPSPIEAMWLGGDCIHLGDPGYAGVAESLWREYYHFAFDGIFRDSFESGDTSLWQPSPP